MIDKQKVGKLLTSLQTLDVKSVTKKDGNLDIEKFNELPEVKEVVSKLKVIGVNRGWLFDNGFTNAGFILHTLGETQGAKK